jgi:choline dehydrogenase-like flavoprotein
MIGPSCTHLVVGAGSAGCVLAAKLSPGPTTMSWCSRRGPSYRSATTAPGRAGWATMATRVPSSTTAIG